ncbi:hypothetical protein MTBLM1_180004 [Rhodospirillaceae bacterium LM-1]|nr:hypothetical protein MTBLM1_180004 [Rhodospirillaceae bacterium LM-1]
MCYESQLISRVFAEDIQKAFIDAYFKKIIDWITEPETDPEIKKRIFQRHGERRLGILGICLLSTRKQIAANCDVSGRSRPSRRGHFPKLLTLNNSLPSAIAAATDIYPPRLR